MPDSVTCLVRFATEADMSGAVDTLTFPSDVFVERIALNGVIVAGREGDRAGVLHLSYLWPGHDGGVPFISSMRRT